MKKILFSLMIMVMGFAFTGCGHTKVEQGEVGIKVNMYGSDKGKTEIVGVGGYFRSVGEEIFIYPTTQTQYPFTKDSSEGSENNEEFTFNVQGGLSVAMDINVTAYADATMADILYKNYKTDMESIIKKFVRQEIRNQLMSEGAKLTIDDITNGKLSIMMNNIEENIRAKFSKEGLVIVEVSPINKPRYPKAIEQSIIAKINATQMAIQKENELREAEAQAKIVETRAKAEAMANEAKKVTLTPELLEYEKIQNEKLMIKAWADGGAKVPTTVIMDGKGSNLMLGVPQMK